MKFDITLAGACVLACAAAHAAGPAPAAPRADGYDCVIEPSQTVELRSPVAGVIEKVYVERGGGVRKGAPVVALESSVERAAAELARFKAQMNGAVQSATGRVAHADRKLERKAGLAAQNYASAQEREDAQAEQAIAQADLVAARENRQLAQLELAYASAQLAQRVLHSPIDGVVVDQARYAGEMTEPGDNKPYIVKLAQTNPLRVRLILPLAMVTRVKPGQRAEVTPEAPLEGRYVATVTSVDKVVDAASGTFQVRMELPNPQGALPGGVKCRAALPAP